MLARFRVEFKRANNRSSQQYRQENSISSSECVCVCLLPAGANEVEIMAKPNRDNASMDANVFLHKKMFASNLWPNFFILNANANVNANMKIISLQKWWLTLSASS